MELQRFETSVSESRAESTKIDVLLHVDIKLHVQMWSTRLDRSAPCVNYSIVSA